MKTKAPTPQTPLYQWLNKRAAGVLLHPTSLPSPTGIGNFGQSAYQFVDLLADSGLSIWQLCPLGPTGYGDSPYQCFSAFAGNPYLIDFVPLLEAGLVQSEDLEGLRGLSAQRCDFGALYEQFWPVLEKAHRRFEASAAGSVLDYGSFEAYRSDEASWLESYSVFMGLKAHFGGKCWLEWPEEFRDAKQAAKGTLPAEAEAAKELHAFAQCLPNRTLSSS